MPRFVILSAFSAILAVSVHTRGLESNTQALCWHHTTSLNRFCTPKIELNLSNAGALLHLLAAVSCTSIVSSAYSDPFAHLSAQSYWHYIAVITENTETAIPAQFPHETALAIAGCLSLLLSLTFRRFCLQWPSLFRPLPYV